MSNNSSALSAASDCARHTLVDNIKNKKAGEKVRMVSPSSGSHSTLYDSLDSSQLSNYDRISVIGSVLSLKESTGTSIFCSIVRNRLLSGMSSLNFRYCPCLKPRFEPPARMSG